jgi:predicted metal-dependent phosphotriesterase family hydrolase
MTVTGELGVERLGVVDSHDHIFLRSSAMVGQELDDLEVATEEVRDAAASGIETIVELTPIGLGRRPDLLRQVSEATGVAIVGATGFHRDAHYREGHWVYSATDELLLDRMVADIEQGMHPTDWEDEGAPLDAARAGVIKIGASYHHLSPFERQRLEAAAAASVRGGVSVVCHAEIGTYGAEIADALASGGVASERIMLAHMDRNPDADVHADLLDRGIYLVYDTPGRIKYRPDVVLLDLIATLVEHGYGEQLLLGLDLGSSEYYQSHGGGPGLGYLMRTFVPRLERRIGAEATRAMLVGNPGRAFAKGSN